MPESLTEITEEELWKRYRRMNQFPESGQRHVWACEHRGSQLVVKVCKCTWHREENARVQRVLGRWVQEVQAMQGICDPHIASLIDMGGLLLPDGQRTVYQVEKLVPGQSLRERLGEAGDRGTPVCDLAVLTRGLARAWQCLWQARCVHRDIKPENIVLRADSDAPVVIDLGIALQLDVTRLTGSSESSPRTVPYQSPEQAQGRKQIDPRSDLFNIGLCVYEAATGRHPFAGCNVEQEWREAIVSQPHTSISSGPGVPPELPRVLDTLLAKHAHDRYNSPEEFIVAARDLDRGDAQ